MSGSFVVLVSENGVFSVTAQVPRYTCFLKKKRKNECPERRAVFGSRVNKQKTTSLKKKPRGTMVQVSRSLYCRLLTVCARFA